MISVNKFFELLAPVNAAYNNFAKKEGINYSTLAIFEYLYNNKKATAVEISNNWGTPKQTLHSAIKELEAQGLIVVEENPQDKRSKLLRLTKKGCEKAEPIIGKLQKKEEIAFLSLTDEERKQFFKLTKRFTKKLTEEVNDD